MKLMTAFAMTAVLLLGACGGGSEDQDSPTPEAAPSAEVVPEPTAEPEPAQDYPKGYPKVVPVSDIPEPIDSAFEGADEAVAVAEGVWADFAPGTSPEESGAAGVYSGYCASIAKFEQDYLGGEPSAGRCW